MTEMALESLMGLAYMSDELMQDVALASELYLRAFSDELAFTVDSEIFSGDGVGKMLGFLNAPCTVVVSKEGSQSADTLLLENLVKMWSRMWAKSRKNAVWLINQDIEPQLYTLSQTVGASGVPIFLPSGGLSSAPYGTLFGRPIIANEFSSSIGDLGDIALVDLTQYGIIEQADGPRVDTSMHVRFIYGEETFRISMRNNGQPLWKTALTPYKGTNTVSPFVTLEAR